MPPSTPSVDRLPRFIVSEPRCTSSTCGERNDGCTYQVAWAINPHMRIGTVQIDHAVAEHRAFVHTLRECGAHVTSVPFVHGAFDSVFSKDNAVVVERADGVTAALLASPRHRERAREQASRAAAYEQLGIAVAPASSSPLEGGDVVVQPGAQGAFLGVGFRSSMHAAVDLESFLDAPVELLELVDPRLYHLDMVLSMLDDGAAVVCLEALTPASRRALQRHHAVRDVVDVSLAEALRFSINLVQVGSTIVTSSAATMLPTALRARGYDVRGAALDQFHRAGGGAACLVATVHRSADRAAQQERLDSAPPASKRVRAA